MNTLRLLLLMAIAHISFNAAAATATESARDWVPIGTVMEDAGGDITQMAYVVARCSAVHYALAQSFQSRADTDEISAQFESVGAKLLAYYTIANNKIAGRETASEEQTQAYSDTVVELANGYIEAFGEHWEKSGSHISGDAFLEQEVTICRSVASGFGS